MDTLYARMGLDFAAERAQVRSQSVGDLLGPATRQRPANRVRQHAEDQSERCRRPLFQPQK